MTKNTHTELSPSNADRWMNCPGSVALCRTLPKPPQSPSAIEGETAHNLLEQCLKNPRLSVFDLTEDEEMAEAVAFVIDYVREEFSKGKKGQLIVEQQLSIFPGVNGRLDIAIIRPYDSLKVIDFKYGKGTIVSAVDNPQMLLYAVPLINSFDVMTVDFVILQPRVDNMKSEWSCSFEFVLEFAREAQRRIAIAQEPNAPICSGTWCKFCYAKAICPVLRKTIATNLPITQGKELILPDTKILSPQTLIKVLTYKDIIEKWLDAVAAYAHEYVSAGGVLEDETSKWVLDKKRAHRRWKNEQSALMAFADLGDKAFEVKILSPAKLEKIAGKDRVAPLVEIPDTGLTLKKVGKL